MRAYGTVSGAALSLPNFNRCGCIMNAITFTQVPCNPAAFPEQARNAMAARVMNSSFLDLDDYTGLLSRSKVMLVEDSALIRDALNDALALSSVANFDGFATTATEAINSLRAERYDIVVIDIELAHGTGFDVLQDMNQADFPYTRPICMVLTNHSHPIYKHKALLMGVKYFFDKSMHFDEAIETIEMEASRLHLGSN